MDDKSKLYWKYLPVAYELYYNLYGRPKTHAEYANGFNIRGEIVRTIIKTLDNEIN